MGTYDHTMKALVDADPEAIAQFVLRQWRLSRGIAVQEAEIQSIEQLNTEFQGTEAEADGLLLITTRRGRLLIHIEFQSKRDPLMSDRQLDYCRRARHKHGPLDILSCVIYLRDDRQIEEPPWCWYFEGQVTMALDFVCIKLWEFPREELLVLNQPGLLPLALLTKGKVDRILVKEMFETLLANKLYDLLPVGQTIAGWLLQGASLEWLRKEYRKMLDFFKDSPAYEWMTEDAREEGLAQGLAQGLEQGRAEGLTQARQQALDTFRQTVVTLITERFPKLARLARKQVGVVESLERLQHLILRVSLSQDASEIEELLLDLDEGEESAQ